MKSFWYMIKFFFHRKEELYLSLKQILGFYPHHIYYYKLAFIHRSLGERDNKGKQVNNERLEYLGDAILEAVVSDILYRKYKNAYEGFLTTTRSKIVQRSTLNELSLKLGLIYKTGCNCKKRTKLQKCFIGVGAEVQDGCAF